MMVLKVDMMKNTRGYKKENLKEKMGLDYDDGEWSRHSKNSFFFFLWNKR
jgi:hypothetical protein